MKKIILILALGSLTACAGVFAPTPSENRSASYGVPISNVQCHRLARLAVENSLKDPYSARFSGISCTHGYWESHKFVYGYVFTGSVNAKGGFGGYTGHTKFAGILRDGGKGVKLVKLCFKTNSNCSLMEYSFVQLDSQFRSRFQISEASREKVTKASREEITKAGFGLSVVQFYNDNCESLPGLNRVTKGEARLLGITVRELNLAAEKSRPGPQGCTEIKQEMISKGGYEALKSGG